MIDKYLLQQLEGIHPARRMDYDTLYMGLMDQVKLGNIKMDTKGTLVLFNYSRQCTYNQAWNIFTLIARGLILDTKYKEIVATPFPKFFNWETETDYIPENEPFDIIEKIDGCLGVIYFHDGSWHVASRGSLKSDVAKAGQAMLDKNGTDGLIPGVTYICEIVHEKYRIVVPYDHNALYLLGAYSKSGAEFDEVNHSLLFNAGFRFPYHYSVASSETIESITEQVRKWEYTSEGVVVKYPSGHRMKIKSLDYLKTHRLVSDFSPLRVWNLLMDASVDDLHDIRDNLPEPYKTQFDELADDFEQMFILKINTIREIAEDTKEMSNQELNQWLHQYDDPHAIKRFIFPCRNMGMDFVNAAYEPGSKTRRNIYKTFRPDNNVMDDVNLMNLKEKAI